MKIEIKKKRTIIQTRENKHTKLIKKLKKSRDIHFIYEHRGVGAEEYINNLGFETISKVKDQEVIDRYHSILENYKGIFDVSDTIVNVSEQMKNYVKNKFQGKYDSKLMVVPGGADQNIFYYSEKERIETRERLKITGKTKVLLYSGSLVQKWHMSDFIFQTIERYLTIEPDSVFICITPDKSLALELTDKHSIPRNNAIIEHLNNDQINPYLNAADLGLIFREYLPTNIYASPTKIAEYLLAGLPTVISRHIGDYSDFIEKKGVGFVVDNDPHKITNTISNSGNLNRKWISQIGQENYSKQQLLNKYLKLYEQILN